MTLARAIPLPDPNFPLQDLLEFKHKRSDEIVGLTHELDKFYSQIANARDSDFELYRLLRVVDKQCADLIKASRESKRKFHVGDFSISLSIDSIESAMIRSAASEAYVLATTGLPIVGAVLGAASSFVSFGRDIGSRRLSDRSSPFKVVGDIHKELI